MPHDMMMDMEDMKMPELLDKAIQYHQEHIDDPASATPKSQQVLMDLLLQIQKMMPEGMMKSGEDESEMPAERDPYMSENRMPMNLMKRRSMMKE
jgi:hypothetical protein